MTTKYPVAERFREVQGEGAFVGTRMAFVRMVGCSVGQHVCTSCDTQFDRMRPELGGGSYTVDELVAFTDNYRRMCITGGEPLDRDIRPLLLGAQLAGITCHVETSGTRKPEWLLRRSISGAHLIRHPVEIGAGGETLPPVQAAMWLCVSPKPGYREDMVLAHADEVKVIIGGLGDGPGWPTVDDARRWAGQGKLVFVQPRNYDKLVDDVAMEQVLQITDKYPELRLSCQLHKFLGVR